MSIDRLRTIIEGANKVDLIKYKHNLISKWDRFTDKQKRDTYERLSQFEQFRDILPALVLRATYPYEPNGRDYYSRHFNLN